MSIEDDIRRIVQEELAKALTPPYGPSPFDRVIYHPTQRSTAVSAQKPNGPADVCHVGNGPTSPANARLIAAAPDLLAAVESLRAIVQDFGVQDADEAFYLGMVQVDDLIARVKGEQ